MEEPELLQESGNVFLRAGFHVEHHKRKQTLQLANKALQPRYQSNNGCTVHAVVDQVHNENQLCVNTINGLVIIIANERPVVV